jgi:hypothetical protein
MASNWLPMIDRNMSTHPCGIKQWKHGAHLLYRLPEVEWTEAKGHQGSLDLAQNVLDFPCLGHPGRLELL